MNSEAMTSSSSNEEPIKTVDDSNVFVLSIWQGDWSLPTIDPECLVALCYLKFTNLPFKVVLVDKSLDLLRNVYPSLSYKNEVYAGLESVLSCIKKQKNLSKNLNNDNYMDMLAQLNYFKEKFLPAFKMLCWLDEENTYTVIRRAYGKYLRFPFSFVKLKLMTVAAQNSIMCQYNHSHVTYDNIKPHLINEAKECLTTISNHLSKNVFMYENQPTLIDAYLFGYLSILNKAPFISSPIKSHLSMCSNLNSFTSRIQKEFFSVDIAVELSSQYASLRAANLQSTSKLMIYKENLKKIDLPLALHILNQIVIFAVFFTSAETGKKKSTLEETEELETRKQRVLAAVVGVVAMLSYAYAIGLIKFSFDKFDYEYSEKRIN